MCGCGYEGRYKCDGVSVGIYIYMYEGGIKMAYMCVGCGCGFVLIGVGVSIYKRVRV